MRHGKHWSYEKQGERPYSDVVCPVSNPTPATREAASLLKGGQHFDFTKRADRGLTRGGVNKSIANPHWESPPLNRQARPSSVKDLKGHEFGRFTVYSFFSEAWGGSERKWVCRCVCGRYEIRREKSLFNPLNEKDSCSRCRHLSHIQFAQAKVASGEWQHPTEYYVNGKRSLRTESRVMAAAKARAED